MSCEHNNLYLKIKYMQSFQLSVKALLRINYQLSMSAIYNSK